MERLTIADEKLPNGYIRRTLIDGYKVREHAMDFYWALKKYEDTGYGPEIFARVYAPETPFEIALDAEVHKLRMENVRLTAERDAEKRRADAAEHKIYEIAHSGLCSACEQDFEVCQGADDYDDCRDGCPFVNLFLCGEVTGAIEPDGPCAENAPENTESEDAQ